MIHTLVTASGLRGQLPLAHRSQNVGKGSRQTGSVTSGQGLALSTSRARRAPSRGAAAPRGGCYDRTGTDLWESDCLIKTEHRDVPSLRGIDAM